MPRAKCNLYDIGCEVALAVRWPGHVAKGRVVEDFVNLMDLAPTFCEAGGRRFVLSFLDVCPESVLQCA